MDVYVARQPIFNRNMGVYGYELLYRRSKKNIYEGLDDNQATAEVISNSFLTMHFEELTAGTKAFINFSHDMLIQEIPFILPKESTVVEVLERVEMSDELLATCEKLRDKGYIIALDDFIFEPSYLPLLDIAHIVKVEFPSVDINTQKRFIKKYKHKLKFLAEKVETREEYQIARNLGYDYFQGYFFSKPVVVHSKGIDSLKINHIQIINELDRKEVDFQKIEEIIQTDVGLSYKLLRLANSALFGGTHKITSIKQALVRLGIAEIRTWIYLLMLKDIENIENKELLKVCLIRAKFMELLAVETGKKSRKNDYFLVGLFSEIDSLLNRPMEEILDELALDSDVKNALLKKDNTIKRILDLAKEFEQKSTWSVEKKSKKYLTNSKVMDQYMCALTWALEIDYN